MIFVFLQAKFYRHNTWHKAIHYYAPEVHICPFNTMLWSRIHAIASIAPCRWRRLSAAPSSGTTWLITSSITLLVIMRLSTARQRPAICRMAESGCSKHRSRLSAKDSNWPSNNNQPLSNRVCTMHAYVQRTKNNNETIYFIVMQYTQTCATKYEFSEVRSTTFCSMINSKCSWRRISPILL